MAKIQEVPNADSGNEAEPLEQVHYDTDHNVFANDLQHFEQSESIRNTCAVETGDSNVIPDSPDMCDNDIQNDQHDVECDDERVALANLIANLKLDVDDNKKIQKQLKKANATLTQELTECKSILAETSRTLGESNSIRDSCLVALQNKQTEFERYKAFNDRTVDYDKLERKLNETLGLLAQKDIDIQEGLKVKAYEISVVQAKHDELVKQSLLTRSHYEGLVKERKQRIYSDSNDAIVQLILFIVDSGCTKHMTGNLSLLCNFVEKYLGTVRFGNDQFALILGYGDLVQGNITIKRVYYVEGLNHNLFSVGQFCDANLEVAFRKSTCFVRDLQGNDLLTGNRGTDLYTISLQETTSSTPICLMAKASPTQAWLWHRRLSHLNFDYINLLSKKDVVIGLPKLKYVKDQLCSSCEVSKAKRSSFKSKTVPSSKGRLNLLHMDLCGPMRVASINGKKYILVIVDDYSRYTWTLFLRSKDETPEVLKDFLTMIQRNLQALVIFVRIDRGTEFLNKTLNAFFKEEGIEHQTSTPQTPE
ncbi:retrovirus-related pol polyprotein from transposon TNT 1-94 [Tanacetum coccineum]